MKISLLLSLSLMICALVIGIGIGIASSPVYQKTMFEQTSVGLGQTDRWLDLRYLNAMAAHHRGAILLAKKAQKESKRAEIHGLAIAILENEPKLITELQAWKRAWYTDSRGVKDPIIPNLSSYDEKFDLRFLNALIAHHETGVNMTQEVRLKSSNKDVLSNADAVETFLTGSLVTLKEWRQTWYPVQ